MDKIRVMRANVILDISPDEKDIFMQQGYSVVDEDSNIIEEAMSKDVGTLQIQVRELKAKVAELEAQLAEKSKPATRKTAEKKAE